MIKRSVLCAFGLLLLMFVPHIFGENSASAQGNVVSIRGSTIKLFSDSKGREPLKKVKVKDIQLPAKIVSKDLNAPYLQVDLVIPTDSSDPIKVWLQRFKVKTDIIKAVDVHCSANDDPNAARVAGVRAAGVAQCK